jgi:hypothetical protein
MKRFAGLMMIVFLFVAAIPTFAQVTQCYDLSADDCEIVTNSTLATASLTGLSVEFEADVAVTGLALVSAMGAGEAPDDIAMNVVGSGDIDLSQDTPALAFDFVVTNVTEGESFNLGVAIVDGALYLVTPEGTVAVTLDAATLAELGLPADFLSSSPSSFGDLMGSEEVDVEEVDLSAIAPYITYAREADNADGDSVFAFHLDITGLLNSPQVSELLAQVGGFAGDSEEVAQVLAMLPIFFSMIDSEVGVTQSINADGYVSSFAGAFYLAMDLGAFIAPDAGLDPIEIGAEVNLGFSNFDAPNAIVAPEDATFLTAAELQQILGSVAP